MIFTAVCVSFSIKLPINVEVTWNWFGNNVVQVSIEIL